MQHVGPSFSRMIPLIVRVDGAAGCREVIGVSRDKAMVGAKTAVAVIDG
jgi:hypothetical protein